MHLESNSFDFKFRYINLRVYSKVLLQSFLEREYEALIFMHINRDELRLCPRKASYFNHYFGL